MKKRGAMTEEQRDRRMAAFLAKPARSEKTRAYVASLTEQRAPAVAAAKRVLALAERQALSATPVTRFWGRRPSGLFASRAFREDLRHRLYRAMLGRCGLCSEPLDDWDEVTFDHVVPRSLGGDDLGNLLPAHLECNQNKGNRPPTGCERVMLAVCNARLDDH